MADEQCFLSQKEFLTVRLAERFRSGNCWLSFPARTLSVGGRHSSAMASKCILPGPFFVSTKPVFKSPENGEEDAGEHGGKPRLLIKLAAGEVKRARETISGAVASLVRESAGLAGLEALRVKVTCFSREFFGAVRMMFVKRSGFVEGGSGGEEEACAICLEETAAGEVVARTPCGHRFHERCIYRWFVKSAHCPLCRFQICP